MDKATEPAKPAKKEKRRFRGKVTHRVIIEDQVIKAFNKRFPEISVEMVRAPGGQLITRIRTEAAAGKRWPI